MEKFKKFMLKNYYLCLRVTAPAWKPPQHVVQKAGDYAWISLAEADYAPIKKDCVSL